ncbi:MAG: glycerol-3-phosphate 1-O-acyltransferase PlsY [Verrucomicrobia bacterium]|nr:glycerol-3-phosphate 1-O-acyltransferase PlsY [Verrucomicrobiota bacterium]
MITAVAAYLLGSIPTGYIVAKAKGVDIRSVGSGNIGATNVFRILGKKAGIFVLTVDALKGFLAVWLVAPMIARNLVASDSLGGTASMLAIVAGISAILGHNYTCWLKFKGGKGIATSAGVLLGLVPLPFVFALITWILLFFLSRYVSLASIGAAAILPITTWLVGHFGGRFSYQGRLEFIIVTLLMAALAIYKHRANIQRLLNGTENRVGKKKTETPK